MTRWNRRLLLGAVALLVPALAGCEAGLNAPTLQFHPASSGVSVIHGNITIDDAFVLGPGVDSMLPAGGQASVFLSLQSANGDRLVSASAPGTAASVALLSGPVSLPPQQLVDLSGPVPEIALTGLSSPLSGGETVQLVLDFANEGAISLNVPVEPAAYDYATYSPPPIPTPAPSPSATKKAKAKARGSASPSATGTASASPSATP